MKRIALSLWLVLVASVAFSQGQGPVPKAPINYCTVTPTNVFPLPGPSSQVMQITAFNVTANDVYLMVIYTNALPSQGHPPDVFIGTVFSELTAVYQYPTGIMLKGTGTLTNAYLVPSLVPQVYSNATAAASISVLTY